MKHYNQPDQDQRTRDILGIVFAILLMMGLIAAVSGCKDRTAKKPQVNQGDTIYLTNEDVQWEPYFEFDSSLSVDLRAREAYTAMLLKEEVKKQKRKHDKTFCLICKDKSTTTVIISHGDGNNIAGEKVKDKSDDQAVKGDGNTTTEKNKGQVVSGHGNELVTKNGLNPLWLMAALVFVLGCIIVYLWLKK